MKRLLLLLLLAITYSCQEIQLPAGVNDLVGGGQFIAFDVYPSDSEVGEENNINLPYAGISGSATSCTLTNLNNITETTSCSCVAGLCSVGVSGILGGASASFDYIIIAGSKTSNLASGSFNISSANSAPIADDLTPADLTEDVLSRIDLSYTDADSDVATSCSVFSLVNVDEVTECSCTLGACSVDIRGTSNYNGAASFSYTVSTGTDNSNTATASFTIAAVDDAPTTSDLSPSSFDVNTQETITLTYNDIESDEAISCATCQILR